MVIDTYADGPVATDKVAACSIKPRRRDPRFVGCQRSLLVQNTSTESLITTSEAKERKTCDEGFATGVNCLKQRD